MLLRKTSLACFPISSGFPEFFLLAGPSSPGGWVGCFIWLGLFWRVCSGGWEVFASPAHRFVSSWRRCASSPLPSETHNSARTSLQPPSSFLVLVAGASRVCLNRLATDPIKPSLTMDCSESSTTPRNRIDSGSLFSQRAAGPNKKSSEQMMWYCHSTLRMIASRKSHLTQAKPGTKCYLSSRSG